MFNNSKQSYNNCFSLLDEDNEDNEIIDDKNTDKLSKSNDISSDPLTKYYNMNEYQHKKKQSFNKVDPFITSNKNTKKSNNINTKTKINNDTTPIIKKVSDDTINEKMPNLLKIYSKHLMDKDWNDITNYFNLIDLTTWEGIPKFYNSLKKNIVKVKEFHIFLMKNNIYPLWEDNENRKGSIIKIRVDTIEQTIYLMNLLTIHFMNKNILKDNNEILNGISFNPKKGMNKGVEEKYYIIQIWLKNDLSSCHSHNVICNNEINKLLNGYSVRVNKTLPEF
jgi:hypothetical protein